MRQSNAAAIAQHLGAPSAFGSTTTLTPAEFRAAHPDVTTWSAADHDVHRNLIEIERAASGLSTIGLAALDRLLAATTELAWQTLAEQDMSWAARLPQQVEYELAAGGLR